jgi:CCR4-NOT transcriptional regulation complex NOT5 subunit
VEKIETKMLNIRLHEELMERLRAHCKEREMTIKEFVTDAIIEKLKLAHTERRKKPRL